MARFISMRALIVTLVLGFSTLAMAAQTSEQSTQQTPQLVSEKAVQLDINSADAQTIADTLSGIGLTKAQDIVAYREMYGDFRSVDELIEVRGIGEATLAKIRHQLVVVPKIVAE